MYETESGEGFQTSQVDGIIKRHKHPRTLGRAVDV